MFTSKSDSFLFYPIFLFLLFLLFSFLNLFLEGRHYGVFLVRYKLLNMPFKFKRYSKHGKFIVSLVIDTRELDFAWKLKSHENMSSRQETCSRAFEFNSTIHWLCIQQELINFILFLTAIVKQAFYCPKGKWNKILWTTSLKKHKTSSRIGT